MNIEGFRSYCLQKRGTTEDFPFGENTLVMKVMGKIYAITDVESFESINLKVDPEVNAELRERYPAVAPGYHMNKRHWMTVQIDGTIPDRLLLQWVDNSYQLVAAGLNKSDKSMLGTL